MQQKKLELYYKKDYRFIYCTKEQIEKYVNNMIDSKKHLDIYNNDELKVSTEVEFI